MIIVSQAFRGITFAMSELNTSISSYKQNHEPGADAGLRLRGVEGLQRGAAGHDQQVAKQVSNFIRFFISSSQNRTSYHNAKFRS